jgi:hypothetical protein
MEEWTALAEKLSENGYTLWQVQYRANLPEGFHARFWNSQKPVFEIVTYSEEIEDKIVKYISEYQKPQK